MYGIKQIYPSRGHRISKKTTPSDEPAERPDESPLECDETVEFDVGDLPTDPDTKVGKRLLEERPVRLLLTLASLVVVIGGMRYASGVLNPILVALFIVMGISPVLDWMRRKRVPGWLAITIVTIAFLALAAAFGGIIAAHVDDLSRKLPEYGDKLETVYADLANWFGNRGIDTESDYLSGLFDPQRLTDAASTLLNSIVDAFSNVFLMLLIVLFMLAQVFSFPRRVYTKLCLSARFEKSFKDFAEVTRSYLFTKGWLALVAAVISTGVYAAFGVDFFVIWGILFFVLSFIPNFGFIISVIPPAVVTILEYGFTRAILMVAVVVVMNFVVDNILAPRFMSRSVGLSTLSVFLSLIIWTWILGPVGALISVPLTLMVKLLIFDSYESTRFISMFLTGGRQMTSSAERRRRKKQACETED